MSFELHENCGVARKAAKGDAMPFTDTDGSSPSHLQLEPAGLHDFYVVRGFKYRAPGAHGAEYVVQGNYQEKTDLASVPFLLQWFVRSTECIHPAVLHDHLWRKRPDVPLEESNRVFRVAMHEQLPIPFLRRWVMWAAVSLAGLAKGGMLWRVRAMAWVVAILGLDAVTAWAVVKGGGALTTTLAVIFLLASLVLLLPHALVTVLGGPTLYLFVPASLVVLATLLVFLVAESAAYVVGWVLSRVFKRRIGGPDLPLLRRKGREVSTAVMTFPEVEEHPPSV